MLNVLINGCNGRMGQVIANEINNFPNLLLVAGFSKNNLFKSNFPIYSNTSDIKEAIDVIIDFSAPTATLNILKYAINSKIAMVIATTGFSNKELLEIKAASKIIPIFKSSNMSYDMQLMKKIVAEVAAYLNNTDIEIVETHHNKKIDAPSGTALMLADSINKALGNNLKYIFNRHNLNKKRKPNEIGFSSIRGGNIVGEHSVQFYGSYETFEIKHTSYSRNIYAEGALKACEFIVGKPPKLYSMEDMI